MNEGGIQVAGDDNREGPNHSSESHADQTPSVPSHAPNADPAIVAAHVAVVVSALPSPDLAQIQFAQPQEEPPPPRHRPPPKGIPPLTKRPGLAQNVEAPSPEEINAKQVAEAAMELMAEPIAEPTGQPITDALVQPALEPVAEIAVEGGIEAADMPTVQPAPALTVQPTHEPIVEPDLMTASDEVVALQATYESSDEPMTESELLLEQIFAEEALQAQPVRPAPLAKPPVRPPPPVPPPRRIPPQSPAPRSMAHNPRLDFLALIAVSMIMIFQNCANANFSATPDATNDTNVAFNPANVDAFTCRTFSTIASDPSGRIDVPARDTSGTCYVMKILSAVNHSPSSNNPEQDQEVLSRNHDSDASDPLQTHHPYTLGSKLLNLYMEGARSILLTGARAASTSITVDNFLLVGLGPSKSIADPSYYAAYGTSDSTIELNGKTDSIEFRNQPVVLTPFASSGISTVKPLSLESEIELRSDYTLDIRALDCGSVGELSDVYLLFQ